MKTVAVFVNGKMTTVNVPDSYKKIFSNLTLQDVNTLNRALFCANNAERFMTTGIIIKDMGYIEKARTLSDELEKIVENARYSTYDGYDIRNDISTYEF